MADDLDTENRIVFYWTRGHLYGDSTASASSSDDDSSNDDDDSDAGTVPSHTDETEAADDDDDDFMGRCAVYNYMPKSGSARHCIHLLELQGQQLGTYYYQPLVPSW